MQKTHEPENWMAGLDDTQLTALTRRNPPQRLADLLDDDTGLGLFAAWSEARSLGNMINAHAEAYRVFHALALTAQAMEPTNRLRSGTFGGPQAADLRAADSDAKAMNRSLSEAQLLNDRPPDGLSTLYASDPWLTVFYTWAQPLQYDRQTIEARFTLFCADWKQAHASLNEQRVGGARLGSARTTTTTTTTTTSTTWQPVALSAAQRRDVADRIAGVLAEKRGGGGDKQ